MTVKEAEEQSGITRANIRFYEKEGLLIICRNPVNSYRDYSEENIKTIKKIIFLRNLDITIEDIRRIQHDQEDFKEFLAKHAVDLKRKTEMYKNAQSICMEMIGNPELNYQLLDVDRYQEGISREEVLKKDTISYLVHMKDKIIVWFLTFVGLLTAVIAYFLLPDQIPVQWSGLAASAYAHKIFIFLYPGISLILVLFLKRILWYTVYTNFPAECYKVENITWRLLLILVVILLSCQWYTLAFLNGTHWRIDYLIVSEIVISSGIVLVNALRPGGYWRP